MVDIPDVALNDGRTIPQLGFGVFLIPPAETARAVRTALEAGYCHVDTAQMYRNEAEVARGIADAGMDREQVFITTKVDNNRHGLEESRKSVEESLRRLGSDYVDLLLIHWPQPSRDEYVETWDGLVRCREQGKAVSVGVSNFQVPHLERIAEATGVVPAINQIELHPKLGQPRLQDYHREHGIATEAWSPIARGAVLDEPVVTSIASTYGKTAAQVVLRWHLQRGNVVFPKSVTPSRIAENIDIFDFELADDDLTAIDAMDAGERLGPNPDTFTS
jgi:2,5-diketo-D-gluconate reductase A